MERFRSHSELSKKDWTKYFRPWVIVRKDFFDLKSNALKKEKHLKSAIGREFIRNNGIHKRKKGSYLPAGGRRFEPSLRN